MPLYLAGNEPKSALLCVAGSADSESFQAAEYQTLRGVLRVKAKEAGKAQSSNFLHLWNGIPRQIGTSFPSA
jgi:hypothetical protein